MVYHEIREVNDIKQDIPTLEEKLKKNKKSK